jgi:cation transport regulator ChaC
MKSPTFYYFAYGSNMLFAKLQRDAPYANNIGVAMLCGYKLCWHKPSTIDKSGKCDIAQSDKGIVYGVLYEITAEGLATLDKTEGGYERRQVNVEHAGNIVKAWTYFAKKQDSALLPYSWYKALVLAGAKAAKLPKTYIDQIESVTANQDTKRERHDKHMAIAEAGILAV